MQKGYVIRANYWDCSPDVLCLTKSDALELAMSLFEEASFYEFNYSVNWFGVDPQTALHEATTGVCIIRYEMIIY